MKREREIKRSGFTLIELLVVVLIIGILSAVALPQYEKAVEKSRLAEAQANIGTLKQAIESYLLANNITGTVNPIVDIDFPCTPTQASISIQGFACKHFVYEPYCNQNGCHINAFRYYKSDYSDIRSHYVLSSDRTSSGQWLTTCIYYENNSLGHQVCKTLSNATLRKWE